MSSLVKLFSFATVSHLSFEWNLGVVVFAFLVLQMVSGVLLAMYFDPTLDGAFLSVDRMCSELLGGWFVSNVHGVGASLFFFLVYLHIIRGLAFGLGSFVLVWVSGFALYIMLVVEAFLGYSLVMGSMSYWAITVVVSMFSVLGDSGCEVFSNLCLGGEVISDDTVSRFFVLHVVMPFIMLGVSLFHMLALHLAGSSKDFDSSEVSSFYPYMFWKDVYVLLFFVMVLVVGSCLMPYQFFNYVNFQEFDPLVTPEHMAPEWYLKPYFIILKSYDSKLLGMCVLLFVFSGLLFSSLVGVLLSASSVEEAEGLILSFMFVLGFGGLCVSEAWLLDPQLIIVVACAYLLEGYGSWECLKVLFWAYVEEMHEAYAGGKSFGLYISHHPYGEWQDVQAFLLSGSAIIFVYLTLPYCLESEGGALWYKESLKALGSEDPLIHLLLVMINHTDVKVLFCMNFMFMCSELMWQEMWDWHIDEDEPSLNAWMVGVGWYLCFMGMCLTSGWLFAFFKWFSLFLWFSVMTDVPVLDVGMLIEEKVEVYPYVLWGCLTYLVLVSGELLVLSFISVCSVMEDIVYSVVLSFMAVYDMWLGGSVLEHVVLLFVGWLVELMKVVCAYLVMWLYYFMVSLEGLLASMWSSVYSFLIKILLTLACICGIMHGIWFESLFEDMSSEVKFLYLWYLCSSELLEVSSVDVGYGYVDLMVSCLESMLLGVACSLVFMLFYDFSFSMLSSGLVGGMVFNMVFLHMSHLVLFVGMVLLLNSFGVDSSYSGFELLFWLLLDMSWMLLFFSMLVIMGWYSSLFYLVGVKVLC